MRQAESSIQTRPPPLQQRENSVRPSVRNVVDCDHNVVIAGFHGTDTDTDTDFRDAREEVGEEVRVGVRVRVGPVEFKLNQM